MTPSNARNTSTRRGPPFLRFRLFPYVQQTAAQGRSDLFITAKTTTANARACARL
jgi:hypothetical protein